MSRKIDIAAELAMRHQGVWSPVTNSPKPGLGGDEKSTLYADAALAIPDTLRLTRARIAVSKEGFSFNNTDPIKFPGFSRNALVDDAFIKAARGIIEWTQATYRTVITNIHTEPLTNPLASRAVDHLDNNLPKVADKARMPGQNAEAFLTPGGESAFYVLKALLPAIPAVLNGQGVTTQTVIDALRTSTVPLTLATGIHAKNIISVLNGMQKNHRGQGFNPDVLQRGSNNIVELKYSPHELTQNFGQSEHDEPKAICPAAVSRRHVLGPHMHALQNEFPSANAVLGLQQMVADLLENLLS